MGRKKTPVNTGGQDDARNPRFKEYTPDDVREVAETIREVAGRVEAIADEMESAGLGKIGIDGAQKPQEGLSKIKVFIGNAKKTIEKKT